jgi:hypothetical protein
VRFVLAGAGHLAGVINPPGRNKYQYWTGAKPSDDDLDAWLSQAQERPGSWWPDWLAWLKQHGIAEVPARRPGDGNLPIIEDAPGSYVKMTLGNHPAPHAADRAPDSGDEIGAARMAEFTQIISAAPAPVPALLRRPSAPKAVADAPVSFADVRPDGDAATQQSTIMPGDGDALSDARMAEFTQIIAERPPPMERAGAAAGRRKARQFPAGLCG